ncbi:cytochrome P450 6k1-like isoform X2 [Hyposmocoma kahamanoa]|nr:cytochrome P450 6k1-like isoform X2 [Hyposmocoma kahamanoa]XP_026317377.1 cytochrome P450 6k1-like isoform X2 [Hyposmocoma kahamanoa]
MFLYLVVTSCVCLLAWVYLRWLQVKQYWAKLNVPFIEPHPVLGNLDLLIKGNPADFMLEIYNRSNGSLYTGIWQLWRPTIVINCPKIAERILIKDFDNFRDRFAVTGESDPTGSLNLFFLKEPKWSSVRRHLTPVFTSAKLRMLEDLAEIKSKQLTQRIYHELSKNEAIDIKALYTDFTTDIIGTASFGIESDATLTGDGPLRKVTKELSQFSLYRKLAWGCYFLLPEYVDMFGFTFFPKSTNAYFLKIFHEAVQLRGGFDHAPKENKDLLDALIKMKYDAATKNEEMGEDLLVAQAAVFLQGGFETTASNLTFLSVELAHNPKVQEKLYQELLAAKQKHGKLDAKNLSELKYLNSIIKETLRKYPITPSLIRVPTKNYKIDDKLTIEAGTPVLINLYSMHVNPKYYSDPMTFDPERFNGNEERILMAFGQGPRKCIGERFAYQQIRYAVAAIFLNFELRPRAGSPKSCDIKFAKHSTLIIPADVLTVDFVPRK